jgi:hypothetical protein
VKRVGQRGLPPAHGSAPPVTDECLTVKVLFVRVGAQLQTIVRKKKGAPRLQPRHFHLVR